MKITSQFNSNVCIIFRTEIHFLLVENNTPQPNIKIWNAEDSMKVCKMHVKNSVK